MAAVSLLENSQVESVNYLGCVAAVQRMKPPRPATASRRVAEGSGVRQMFLFFLLSLERPPRARLGGDGRGGFKKKKVLHIFLSEFILHREPI